MTSLTIRGVLTEKDYQYFSRQALLSNTMFYVLGLALFGATLVWFTSWLASEKGKDVIQLLQVILGNSTFVVMVFVMPAVRIHKAYRTDPKLKQELSFVFTPEGLSIVSGDTMKTFPISDFLRHTVEKHYVVFQFKGKNDKAKRLPRHFFADAEEYQAMEKIVQTWQGTRL